MDSVHQMEVNCTSSNDTNSSSYLFEDNTSDTADFLLWKRMCAFGVVVVGIPANLIVIVCLWSAQSSRVSGFSTYATSIAFTDLLVGVALMPIQIMKTYWPNWNLGLSGCILWYIGDFGLTSVSMLLFLAMGYDRYRCVTAPLTYRSQFRKSQATRISVFVWIVGFLLFFPYTILKILLFDTQIFQVRCFMEFRLNVLDIIQFIVGYCIPMLALVAINVALFLKLKGQKLRSYPPKNITFSANMETNISAVNDITEPYTLSKTIVKQEKPLEINIQNMLRTTRSRNVTSYKIILMVMLFLSFWLPFCIIWPVNGLCNRCIPKAFSHIFADVVFFQSAINPLIVIFTSHQIRIKILGIFLK